MALLTFGPAAYLAERSESVRVTKPFSFEVWGYFYSNLGPTLFLVSSTLLGLGGLRRERELGTSSFTLALPVSRMHLCAARVLVGSSQVLVLAAVPTATFPVLATAFGGDAYPTSNTFLFGVLFAVWGFVAFSIGFLISTLAPNDLTAVAGSVLILAGWRVTAELILRRLPYFNPVAMMSGASMPYFNQVTRIVIGPPPWTALLVVGSIGLGMIALAILITQRQEY